MKAVARASWYLAALGGCTALQTRQTRADAAADAPIDVCDDACRPDVAAPRLVAPLSGTTLRSQRPSLRWELSGGDGGRVALCHDRAMTLGCVTFDAEGTTATPGETLAQGVWYWRVTTRAAGATTDARSATWQLRVGTVDSARGTTRDVDGNGERDLAVGAPRVSGHAGRLYVYTRGVHRTEMPERLVRRGAVNSEFGSSVAHVGDVNGDGYDDLAVGAWGENRVWVFPGTTGSLALVGAPIEGADNLERFGERVAGAGDVNGDGYDDLVVSARVPNVSDPGRSSGRAYVYLGGPDGVSTVAASTLTTQGDTSVVVGACGAGDVNGDGYDDVALGAGGATGNAGRVYVFHGGPDGLSEAPATTLVGVDLMGQFGLTLSPARDVNGDGYGDLFVGAPYASEPRDGGIAERIGKVFVFHGGPAGLGARPSTTLVGASYGAGLGGGIAPGADFDGDGYDDLFVGAQGQPAYQGSASLYRGGPEGLASRPFLSRNGVDGMDTSYGFMLTIAGDLNGDGRVDLVVTGVGAEHNAGRVYVYFGEEGGVSATPTLITGPDGAQGVFGWSIARAPRVVDALRVL